MEPIDTLTAIFTRRSIRKFSSTPVESQKQNTLIRSVFSAPSAEDAQTKRLIVITERNMLNKLPTLHPSAGPAGEAPLAFLICCDTSAGPQTVFWPQDCAAATQNVMLAARAMGLGSLWCGIHPVEAREEAFLSAFSLPGMVRPISLIIIGYPEQEFFAEKRCAPNQVFLDKWGNAFDESLLFTD